MIEEITKIGYTACENKKNDRLVQCKMADKLNWMCPELNTTTESNQPQLGVSVDENGFTARCCAR